MKNNDKIIVRYSSSLKGAGYFPNLNINIKFLKSQKRPYVINISNSNLHGLLKLCLLKEISSKLDNIQLNKLPNIISFIMKSLNNGYQQNNNIKNCISDILNKTNGNNIIIFSKYVDEIINSYQLNNILYLLNRNDYYQIIDLKNRLSKYNK